MTNTTTTEPNNTTAQSYGATVARISLGSVLIAHGLLKVLVFTVPGAVAYFENLGIPAAVTYLTIFGEFADAPCGGLNEERRRMLRDDLEDILMSHMFQKAASVYSHTLRSRNGCTVSKRCQILSQWQNRTYLTP